MRPPSHIKISLSWRDPLDSIILEELDRQPKNKKAKFVKLAVLCYIKGMDSKKSHSGAVKKEPDYKDNDKKKLLNLKTVNYLE